MQIDVAASVYARGVIGCHRHYWCLGWFVAARRAVRARGGSENAMHEQSQADWPGATHVS